jgi:hypothetical protein
LSENSLPKRGCKNCRWNTHSSIYYLRCDHFFTCVVTFLFALWLFFYLRCDFFTCVVTIFLLALWLFYLRCDFFFTCVVTFLLALWPFFTCVVTFLLALWPFFYLRCDFFTCVVTFFYLRGDFFLLVLVSFERWPFWATVLVCYSSRLVVGTKTFNKVKYIVWPFCSRWEQILTCIALCYVNTKKYSNWIQICEIL